MTKKIQIQAAKVVSGTLKLLDKTGVNKLQKVDKFTQQLRMAICIGCPKFDKENTACTICLCEMNFKTSLLVDPVLSKLSGTEILISCPDEKW